MQWKVLKMLSGLLCPLGRLHCDQRLIINSLGNTSSVAQGQTAAAAANGGSAAQRDVDWIGISEIHTLNANASGPIPTRTMPTHWGLMIKLDSQTITMAAKEQIPMGILQFSYWSHDETKMKIKLIEKGHCTTRDPRFPGWETMPLPCNEDEHNNNKKR